MAREIILNFDLDFLNDKKDITNAEKIMDVIKTYNKILAFGEVQSGKTKNILDIISFIIEKRNFDIVIILGGTNNMLLNQTQDRFDGVKIKDRKLVYLDKESIKNVDFFALFEDEPVVLINTMKEKSNLEIIKKKLLVRSTKDMRVLIIDDESDYGSINTNKNYKETKIYSLIKDIYGHSKKTKLIMFTATPYANIVNSISDETKPEVIFHLKSNPDYRGLKHFNNSQSLLPISYLRKETDFEILSYNFTKALRMFLIGNSIYCSKNEKRNFELLINVSEILDDHKIIFKLVNECTINLKKHISFDTWRDEFKHELNFFYERNIKINDYDLVFENLFSIFKELRKKENIFMISEKNNKYKSNGRSNRIVIGGNLISRGFTFENLLTEVMCNIPIKKISADTHAQRARWFGYRKKYEDYMTIFCPESSIGAYKEIEILNDAILKEENTNGYILVDEYLKDKLKSLEFEYIDITGGNKKC